MQQTIEAITLTEPVFNRIQLEGVLLLERLQQTQPKERHLQHQEEVQVQFIDSHQEAVLVLEIHITEGHLLHPQEAPPTHQVEVQVQDLADQYLGLLVAVAEAVVAEVQVHQVVVEEDVNPIF